MEYVDKHDDFIESEAMLPIESIVKPEVKVGSPSLELVDPTSFQFISVASQLKHPLIPQLASILWQWYTITS